MEHTDLTTPQPSVPAIAVRREDVPRFYFEGGLWLVLADSDGSGGAIASLEAVYLRGATLPRRVHTREDEFIYVLRGQITAQLGDEPGKVAAEGSFIFVPRGTAREITVISDKARIYNCLMPGGFEKSIQDHGVKTDSFDPPARGTAYNALVRRVWSEYGVDVLEEP